jgi:hypothetical protein
MFIHTILAHVFPGSSPYLFIDSDTTTLSVPNGEAWTIAFSAFTATDLPRIRATFTGTSGHSVNVAVTYEWTEIGSAFTGGGA